MTRQFAAIAAAIALVAAFFWGFMLGSSMGPKTTPRTEPAAQEIRHRSGALTLERDPDSTPPPPLDEPPEPGAVRVRAVTVQLPVSTEPRELQMDLWRLPDGTQRVTAGGQGIRVDGGTDRPIQATTSRKPWAAGLGITHQKQPAAWIMRDAGPFVLAATATKTEFTVGIGWRFGN